jgi:hypothetical protein
MKHWQHWLIGTLVGVLLVGGGLIFLQQHSTRQTGGAHVGTLTSTPNLEQTERSLDVAWIRAYTSDVQQEVAQGLRVSADQAKTQLRAGKSMSQIGAAQGLAPAQLQTLELGALRDAGQKAVQASVVSQAHLDQFLRVAQSDPVYLEQIITGVFIKNASE